MPRMLLLGILIGALVGAILTGGAFTIANVSTENRRHDEDQARDAREQTLRAVEQSMDARKAELDARASALDERAARVAFDESVREYIDDHTATGVNWDGTAKTQRYLTISKPNLFPRQFSRQAEDEIEKAAELKWGVDMIEYRDWLARLGRESYPAEINPNGRARLEADRFNNMFSAVAKLSQWDLHIMSTGQGQEFTKQYPRFVAATIWQLGIDKSVSEAVFLVDGTPLSLHRSRQKPWIFMLTAKQMAIIAGGKSVELRWDTGEMRLTKEDKQAFEDVLSVFANHRNWP